MKVSVVLCSYNGEKYIIEQLESLYTQTRKPDEVIIIDDKSTDSTREKVKSFIKDKDLNNWSLVENSHNVGWKQNFMDGFRIAQGDIIFPCDQDDIWHESKIEIMSGVLEKELQIDVLACNLTPLYMGTGKQISPLYVKKYGKSYLEKVNLGKHFLHTFRPGCAMAFRKSFLSKVEIVWHPEWAHDSVISTLSKLLGTFYILNESLLVFRRHGNNNSPKSTKSREGKIKSANNDIGRIDRFLLNREKLNLDKDTITIINDVKNYLKRRIDYFEKRDLVSLLGILKSYSYYVSFKSFLGDIIIGYK